MTDDKNTAGEKVFLPVSILAAIERLTEIERDLRLALQHVSELRAALAKTAGVQDSDDRR